MERAVVHGVRVVRGGALLTLVGVPDRAGVAARVFRVVAPCGVEPSHVVRGPGRADLSFALPRDAAAPVGAALLSARDRVGFGRLQVDEGVAELMLAGAGLRSDPAVVATFCEALARCAVSLSAVSIENHRLSVLCPESRLSEAVRAVCEAFELRAPAPLLSRVHGDEA